MRKSLSLLAVAMVVFFVARAWEGESERRALERQYISRSTPEDRKWVDLSGFGAEPDVLEEPARTAVSVSESMEDQALLAASLPVLSGIVLDDAGEFVPGCRVILKGGVTQKRQIANRQGEFRFEGVQAGNVKLFVSQSATLSCLPTPNTEDCADDDRPWYGATCIHFDPTQEDPVVLTLIRAAFVEGRVVDSFGVPLSGAIVELKRDDAKAARLMSDLERTGEDGRFSVRALPGTCRLRTFTSAGSALRGSGRPPETEHVLRPGETLDVGDVVIGGGGINLSGRVVDMEGHGAKLVPVRARLIGSQDWLMAETDHSGGFLFEGVYPGRYAIEVAHLGALEHSPSRYLRKSRAIHEVEVTGAGGSFAMGNFQLDFDDSFHLYGRLEFNDESRVVKENLRVWAVPISADALAAEPIYFVSPDKFIWDVREPERYSKANIEVREIDPETNEIRQAWFMPCKPVAQGRERFTFRIN